MTHWPAFMVASSKFRSCFSEYLMPMSTPLCSPLVLAWREGGWEYQGGAACTPEPGPECVSLEEDRIGLQPVPFTCCPMTGFRLRVLLAPAFLLLEPSILVVVVVGVSSFITFYPALTAAWSGHDHLSLVHLSLAPR